MPRADGRIEPGQPLKTALSAAAWNRAQDAADIVLGARTGLSAGQNPGPSYPYTWVMATNRSGAAVDRWGVLTISGLEVPPGSYAQFEAMPVVSGIAPQFADVNWCVAVDPLDDLKVGRVAIGGVVQCKVTIRYSDDTMVRIAEDGSGLETCKTGQAQIIWKEEFVGADKWALIRLGDNLGGMRLGKTTDEWIKGTTYDLNLWPNRYAANPTETVEAVNTFVDVDPDKWVMVAREDCGVWYLISAEC